MNKNQEGTITKLNKKYDRSTASQIRKLFCNHLLLIYINFV